MSKALEIDPDNSFLKNYKGRVFDSYEKPEFTYTRYRYPGLTKSDPPPKPLKSLEGWILFVTNIHEETSEDDIKEAFSEYGEVKNVSLNLDRRTGFVKGYALVEFGTYVNAKSAREMLHKSQLLGVTIKVDWAFVDGPLKVHYSH